MASRRSNNYLAPLYNSTILTTTNHFEFDEADILTSSSPPSSNLVSRAPRKSWGPLNRPSAASSIPVNIPDWSKIMGRAEKGRRQDEDVSPHRVTDDNDEDEDKDDEDDEGGLENGLPPHEYVARKLARSRIVSFSVHEGVGRTLKGRDLSRVRNAVWKQTGFED